MRAMKRSFVLLLAIAVLLTSCAKPIFEIVEEQELLIKYRLVADPSPRYTIENFSPDLFMAEYNELLEAEGVTPLVVYETIEREKNSSYYYSYAGERHTVIEISVAEGEIAIKLYPKGIQEYIELTDADWEIYFAQMLILTHPKEAQALYDLYLETDQKYELGVTVDMKTGEVGFGDRVGGTSTVTITQ